MSPALREQLTVTVVSRVVRQVKYRLERDGGTAELDHLCRLSDEELRVLVHQELAA